MTKAEIIDCVYEKVGGFSKKESAEVVEAVFETMKETLAARRQGQDLRLRQLRGAREEAAHRPQSADRRTDSDQRATRAHVQAEPGAQEHPQSAEVAAAQAQGDRRDRLRPSSAESIVPIEVIAPRRRVRALASASWPFTRFAAVLLARASVVSRGCPRRDGTPASRQAVLQDRRGRADRRRESRTCCATGRAEFPALRPMKTRGAHRVYRRDATSSWRCS